MCRRSKLSEGLFCFLFSNAFFLVFLNISTLVERYSSAKVYLNICFDLTLFCLNTSVLVKVFFYFHLLQVYLYIAAVFSFYPMKMCLRFPTFAIFPKYFCEGVVLVSFQFLNISLGLWGPQQHFTSFHFQKEFKQKQDTVNNAKLWV